MTNNDNPNVDDVKESVLVLSDAVYQRLKFVVQILIPALSTLYFTLSSVWDLPQTEKVIGTAAALTTFLGALLVISTKSYNNSDAKFAGEINIHTNDVGTKVYSLDLKGDPEDIDKSKEVTFKVGSKAPPS